MSSKKYNLEKYDNKMYDFSFNYEYNSDFFKKCLYGVFKNVSVGSKKFLTNKVDRSVTGLIAQQQCVGPFHTPLSNFSLISSSFFENDYGNFTGCASSVGEQSIFGLIDPISMVHKTFAEALYNLVWVLIEDEISASANWMWPCPTKYPKEAYKMYIAVKELKLCMNTGVIINGGKDSLSMVAKNGDEIIKSPGSLVLTFYAKCPNINKKVSPDLKSNNSTIFFIDLSEKNNCMGGSILSQNINRIYNKPPYIRSLNKLLLVFNLIQKLIKEDKILSGHDKSDGGDNSFIRDVFIIKYWNGYNSTR